MAAPPEITQLAREYILREVVPMLPSEVGAVTLEINAWYIRVHTYQYQRFSLTDQVQDALDSIVEALGTSLPVRSEEPWESTVASHRFLDRGKVPEYEGELVFERWAEL